MNKRNRYILLIGLMVAIFGWSSASAHVPYFEYTDFTDQKPFKVVNSIEQSIAVYSFLDPDINDIDVYEFVLDKPAQVYLETLVPVCVVYEHFDPFFAIVGPGLPLLPEGETLPFDIPVGSGVVIMPNFSPDELRPTFYEFFGDKSYYQGPTFDEYFETPGKYRIYVWEPESEFGDYVMVIGNKEIWGFWDIIRAFIYTPLIRQDKELHTSNIFETN